MISETGAEQIARVAAAMPDLAADIAEVVLDPPDRTFERRATVEFEPAGAWSSCATWAAATPTMTSWSSSPMPTSCSAATWSRTTRRPISATASRSTGRRPSSAWSIW